MAEQRWVTDYANCTLAHQFDALVKIVERDVQEMNELPAAVRQEYLFETARDDSDPTKPMFVVTRAQRKTHDASQNLCYFVRHRDAIGIAPVGRKEFDVVLRWSESEGACHLYIKGEETPSALWKISQRALAPQFFGLECVK